MKTGFKMAARVWAYHILLIIIGAFFVSGMGGSWYGILINGVLIAGMMLMALGDGMYQGEKACTLMASIEKQVKDGRKIDEALKAQVFNRKVAAWALLIGALPFLLVSTVNAAVAPFYPEITIEDMQQADTTGSFEFDYEDEQESSQVNPVNLVARIVFMPFVSVYTVVRGGVLNALFFLFSLLMPTAQAIGYLCGPKMREKKLRDIARGKKRKMRNLKVNKKPRQPKAEV